MYARFLSAPDSDGTFDYFANILTLLKYDSEDAPDVYAALNWKSGNIINKKILIIRSLIYHEITHFLDLHTTNWGHQYVYRKLNFVKSLIKDAEDTSESLEVFSVETGEIDIHTELIKIGEILPSDCPRLTHWLKYEPKFGVVLIINYCIGEEIHHQVPLSTLSLLEAHATAKEILSMLEYASSIENDIVEAMIVRREVSELFNELLNDTRKLEYSVLLNLAKLHFAELDFKSLMRLISVLARFCLNATFQVLGFIANRIEETFEAIELGHFISMELRRDSQRGLIFFKTILFMYEWKQHLKNDEKARYVSLLESDPYSAIVEMWVKYKGMEPDDFTMDLGFVFDHLLKKMSDFETPLIDAVLTKENIHNTNLIAYGAIGSIPVQELKIIDMALGDGTIIAMSNSFGIDIEKYFDSNMRLFSKMEKLYVADKGARIHMPPGTAEYMHF